MMHPYLSSARTGEWLYPLSEAPNRQGYLTVGQNPLHRIHWREYGNMHGEPVMVLHGGPGGGALTLYARFFNPGRYRIILFDQRGCGLSEPNAKHHPEEALADNTLPHLVEDIERLRGELAVEGGMHVFGGSWGSTLALAYAIAYPLHVRSLILRGIFLCRQQDLEYFYQGNAAVPGRIDIPGAYRFRPQEWMDLEEPYPAVIFSSMRQVYNDTWQTFVGVIPENERHDMIAAYGRIFSQTPLLPEDVSRQQEAFRIWSLWEGIASFLAVDPTDLQKFEDPDFAPVFARIENHYFNPKTGAFPQGNYLLDNMASLVAANPDIPFYIVQGKYDQVCPRYQADDLVAALHGAGARNVEYILTRAGHSCTERETMLALTRIMDAMPPLP